MLGVLEPAHTALVEVDPRSQRLDAMREMLVVDLHPGDVGHETTKDLEMKRVPLRLAAALLRLSRGRGLRSARLRVECLDDRRRIEEQLQERIQQSPDGAQEAAVRLIKR